MGNYGAPDVNSHVPSAALPPHLYLSRLRPSDRESVPLRPLATDYSLLAHTTPAFGKVELLDQLERAQQLSSSEGLRTNGRDFGGRASYPHTKYRPIFNDISPTFNHFQISQIRAHSNPLILLYLINPI